MRALPGLSLAVWPIMVRRIGAAISHAFGLHTFQPKRTLDILLLSKETQPVLLQMPSLFMGAAMRF
jgi:hypothetical protein